MANNKGNLQAAAEEVFPPQDDIFDAKNEVKSAYIKWGKVGDWIKGTLTSVREVDSRLPGKEGERVKVYEIKASSGSYHDIDEKKNPIEPPHELKPGEFWMVGGRVTIDNQMRNIRIGQIVGLRFTEEKPAKTKGFNSMKIVKVYAGDMDESYQGETSDETAVA